MASVIQDIPVNTIDGRPASLGDYRGSVLLVVNVASKCGLTPQYEALQALYSRYKGQGLVVVGFPANDFAGQEPGTNEEISSFCSTNYGVDFPMFSKLVATGEDRHPLYSALIEAQPKATPADEDMREKLKGYGITPTPEPEVLWNFEKFLVGRDGNVVARFAPNMAPDDPRIVSAIEAELAK